MKTIILKATNIRLIKLFIWAFAFLLCSMNSFSQVDVLTLNDSTIVTIDSLIVTGNKSTRDQVVLAESRLKPGQKIPIKYLRHELNESRKDLFNTFLFNDVELLIFKWTDSNHVSIDFQVNERWYLYPIPVLELTGITFDEWKEDFDYDFSRLTYGLDLHHNNLTKNADKLKVNWRGGFQHLYGLKYNLPGIDKKRNWGVGVNFKHASNKGTIVSAHDNDFDSEIFDNFVFENTAFGGSISRRKNIRRRHTLSVGYQSIRFKDEVLQMQPHYLGNNESFQEFGEIGYSLFIENRNLAEYATDGSYISANFAYQGLFENDFNRMVINAGVRKYEPLSDRFFISGAVFGSITPIYDDTFYSLLSSRVSSLQKVRGFNDHQIFPAHFVTGKSELRYKLFDLMFYDIPIVPERFEPAPLKVFPKVFTDLGQTFAADHDEDNPLNDKFLWSGGIGVDVVTIYNTPLIVELSHNNIGETKVNLGIGKTF